MSKTYKILIIEDMPSDAYLVERQLKKGLASVEIIVADNKEDFLNGLHSLSPDIVLSDYSLPGFDWSVALKTVRELRPDIPFIIVSSTKNPDIISTCMDAGVSGFVSKDYLQDLVPEIKRLLGERF